MILNEWTLDSRLLKDFLFFETGSETSAGAFGWEERYKVAMEVAEALDYLHNRDSQPVIHRDVKSSNILLSEEFEPQVCFVQNLFLNMYPDKLVVFFVSKFLTRDFGYSACRFWTCHLVFECIFFLGLLRRCRNLWVCLIVSPK